VIPPKANRKFPRDCDFALYCERNRVGRFFNKLKHFRAIATRYDKLARNFLAGIQLASAIKAIGCCRMTMRYQTTRADDAGLRQRMKAIAQERRRFGYRRLHVLLKREGYVINHKKLFRLYREEKLAVRRRGGHKRAIGTRAPMLVPMAPNDRWSLISCRISSPTAAASAS
jgi:transposase InsO family protein